MGKVVVIVNDDVRQTLNGTFQVHLGSFESGSSYSSGTSWSPWPTRMVTREIDCSEFRWGSCRPSRGGWSCARVARVGPSSPTLLPWGRRMKVPPVFELEFS
jgi:hypothetical protein